MLMGSLPAQSAMSRPVFEMAMGNSEVRFMAPQFTHAEAARYQCERGSFGFA